MNNSWLFSKSKRSQSCGEENIYCPGHFGWKPAVDDKQVSLEINQSAEREMLRLWRRGGGWGGEGRGGQVGKQRRVGNSLYSLMGCLSWGLASVGSRGIRREMGNQKVPEVRCQSISPFTLTHTRLMAYRGRRRGTLWLWWENSGLKFVYWWSLFSPNMLKEQLRHKTIHFEKKIQMSFFYIKLQ